jgi:hypothetical protein
MTSAEKILCGDDLSKRSECGVAIAASQHLLCIRGLAHMYDYSDIEAVCQSIERDDMDERFRS